MRSHAQQASPAPSAQARFGAQLGARVIGEQTRFAAWTAARTCAVRLYGPGGEERVTHPLEARGGGLFELTVPGARHGTLYEFVLDGRAYPDPYARSLPQGVHGPAMVVEPRYAFRHPSVARPACEQVLYELHVGTFTQEGTYRAALARLPELVRLGVTTIELMPLAAFAGERGWGYDGVAPFAPFAPYGTRGELCALIDEAHGLGLSVLLDVVYNHFGPAGNYFAVYHPDYFTPGVKNAWGDAPNYAHPAMRALALDNARYWLDEFRFDGLRLDAVHAIVDPSPKHIVRELVEMARKLSPRKLLIAEDERNDPALVEDFGLDAVWADDFHHQLRVTLTGERDGYYASYEPGVAGIARAIERGWLFEGQAAMGKPRGKPADALLASHFVYCIQNHDQIGNRALGERLSADVSLEAYCMASMLLLFLPMTPLLFMGQEWAASSPFLFFSDHEPALGALVTAGRREEFKAFRAFADPALRAQIPDPQARETFERSRLCWEERAEGSHARVLELYRELLTLRRIDAVLCDASRDQLEADVVEARASVRERNSDKTRASADERNSDEARASAREQMASERSVELLRVRRRAEGEERVLLANFSADAVLLEPLDLPAERRVLLASGPGSDDGRLGSHAAIILATTTVGVSS